MPTDPIDILPMDSSTDGAPLRILVADDAHANQLILRNYLKEFPVDLKFVADGRAAVEEFQLAPYDLILMDVQMPEMDGLAATKAIRSIEQEQGRESIPIVALTASSDQADIDASLLAGCSAHCCKPVSRNYLLEVIERHCPGLPQALEPLNRIAITAPASLKALASGYLVSRRRELSELKRLLQESNWDRLRVLSHNMKGSGRAYGFGDLTVIGATMERAAKAADIHAMSEQLLRLSDYLSRVEVVSS